MDELDKIKKLPLQITLPLPRTYQEGRGITSVRGPNGCLLTLKVLKHERDKLNKAAAYLGISASMFQRCLVNDAADLIINIFEGSAEAK
jgi:hypothetical protein